MVTFADSIADRCDFCHTLFTHLLPFTSQSLLPSNASCPWPVGDTAPSFPRLKASATAGCGICAFLRSVIIEDFSIRPVNLDAAASPEVLAKWNGTIEFESRLSSYIIDGLRCLRLRLSLGWTERIIDLSLFNHSLKGSQIFAEADTVPLCNKSVSVIQGWLKDCKGHSSCQVPPSKIFAPTRLLYVPKSDRDALCLRTANKPGLEYAALSYCWGKQTPSHPQHPLLSRTTRDNLQARKTSIPENVLPLTIREAITVARRLGIRYLWIDLLCIVQDDPADWSSESQLMGSIFQHASLTIAATSSTSMLQGFLRRPRSRQVGLPQRLLLRYPAVLPPTRSTAPDDSWSRRGWISQEQRLSPRILHFGQLCLYYECACGRRSELRDPSGPAPPPRIFETRYDRAEDIEKFSKTTLSFPADKLPAIAGLAAAYSETLGSEYIAGLWLESIEIGLLWLGVDKLSSPATPRAPSWSWAAVDGAVRWDCFVGRPAPTSLIKLLAYEVTVDPSDPQGRLFTGFLEPYAIPIPLADAEQWDPGKGELSLLEVRYVPDVGVSFDVKDAVWALPVFTCAIGMGSKWEVRGLVLEALDGTPPTRFRRLGWYRSTHQTTMAKEMLASGQARTIRLE
ncbi:heterokaryon incompatibility protein-domain-containing protein [Plectosphaerella plurivora]|uniref:Heterokaryon incompatibility protein-domain-containing protein n=1 Tax=Plectosphaerella plurivora TaxID=936078 RepID=A0A9P9A3I1_9PEZI|nr:heterokaryon incompatibility protein-domain-containing protein [Plectosphaerella plurivora]